MARPRSTELRSIAALLAALTAVACIDFTPADERGRVTVLAPHVLRAGLETAMSGFRDVQSRPVYGVRYGSCAELARAAGDGDAAIVLTAHPAWADYIAGRVTPAARSTIASDTLVVVGTGEPGPARPLENPSVLLDGPRIVGIPSTESEAVGMYAREALLRYGIWSQMGPRLRSFPSLADVLEALDSGEIDAALVTAAAARSQNRQVLVALDPAYHQRLRYEVLLLDGSSAEARALFDHLAGPVGMAAFQSAGLEPPD